MGHPALELAGCWVELGLSTEMESSETALTYSYHLGPGGLSRSNVLNSSLPPQRLRPDTRPEIQDPVSHTAQKKREKKRTEINNLKILFKKIIIIKKESNQSNKQIYQ